MIDVKRLRVSLTKNGYLKIAEVIRQHHRFEVLDHLEGSLPGINLKRSQISNILSVDPATKQLPKFWDEIREYGDAAIDAFTFIAIILSHHKFIQLYTEASQGWLGTFRGRFRRDDLKEKEYTNLVYAMAELNLCEYERGSEDIAYDLYPVVYFTLPAHDLVRDLIASKLARCGWRDPSIFPGSPHKELIQECRALALNRVFSMKWLDFKAWVAGELDIDPPDVQFGLRRRGPRRPRPRHPR